MEINIYWNDLSDEGQNTIMNGGHQPTQDELNERTPIGVLTTKDEEE